MVVLIYLQISPDNKKQLIEYVVGTTWATDFRSTSRPAQLAALPLHVPIKPLIPAGKNSKASVVDLPTAVGKPKYFSAKASCSIKSLSYCFLHVIITIFAEENCRFISVN
jgi:hypothetical protein